MFRIESSTEISKPVEEVYSYVSDPMNEPRWHDDVVEVVPPPEGIREGGRMTWTLAFMGRRNMELEIENLVTNQEERLQAQAPMMGMKPTITYLFAPSGTGTKFTRRVDMELEGAWKMMRPMMTPMVKRKNAGFVNNLKTAMETES
ncbi:MAG TPA: SRPBCC family protein [Actinomycetota bacterium]|nr:SRPBCC family protein [Actinomycetota bacterium]